jgi:hypothetical protein
MWMEELHMKILIALTLVFCPHAFADQKVGWSKDAAIPFYVPAQASELLDIAYPGMASSTVKNGIETHEYEKTDCLVFVSDYSTATPESMLELANRLNVTEWYGDPTSPIQPILKNGNVLFMAKALGAYLGRIQVSTKNGKSFLANKIEVLEKQAPQNLRLEYRRACHDVE